MLPPPFPFKLFVLAAAAFEMNFGHFLLAIFAGRLLRFLLLSLLIVKFGPQVVLLAATLVARHWLALLSIAALLAVATFCIWYRVRLRGAQ